MIFYSYIQAPCCIFICKQKLVRLKVAVMSGSESVTNTNSESDPISSADPIKILIIIDIKM